MEGIVVFLLVLALLGGFLVASYNGLVRLREQTKNGLAQIDVQLKRRYDLIPNLVETVRKFMSHEEATLTKVIEARNSGLAATTPSEMSAANSQLMGGLGQIFALAEAYPELRSNENMLQLQGELKATENKVSFSRQFYNEAVTAYNTKVHSFPFNIVASMFSFQPADLFEVEDESHREPVVVNFG